MSMERAGAAFDRDRAVRRLREALSRYWGWRRGARNDPPEHGDWTRFAEGSMMAFQLGVQGAVGTDDGAVPADGWMPAGWQILIDGRLERTAFGYLVKSGRNAAIGAYRRRVTERRGERLGGHAVHGSADDEIGVGSESELVDAFRAAFRRLDERQRADLIEYYTNGSARLAERDLAARPRGRNGAVRTIDAAEEAVYKRIQRLRDALGAEVFRLTGIRPSTKTKPPTKKRGGS